MEDYYLHVFFGTYNVDGIGDKLPFNLSSDVDEVTVHG